MSTHTPTLEQIVNNYFAAWNASTVNRPAVVETAFTNDAYYCDGAAEAEGRDAIVSMMEGVMTQFEGAAFERTSPIDTHHRQARFNWRMTAADGTTLVDGIDAIRVSHDGQISAALGFFGVDIPNGSTETTSHTFHWSRTYAVPAQRLFDVVTDLDIYADVAPNLNKIDVMSGEGVGLVRRCTNPDGETWTETYTHWSPPEGFTVAVDVATYPPSLAAMIEALEMSVSVEEVAEDESTVSIAIDTELTALGVQVLRDGGAADSLFLPILNGWSEHL